VLVVDDEPAVRDVLQEALETEGYEVLTAENGEQALKHFDDRKGKLDIVFTDIGMPGMSGWDLARAIRKRSPKIPLAIVSGWAEAISCEARQEIKAEWVVPKPFALSSITEIAKEAASRRQLAELKPEVMDKNVCKLLGM
jgi:CheY-like chemotaxis protein